jgi:hypothetical protein
MSNQSCCGLAGTIFGHKFSPRYDENETYPKETAKLMEIAISRVATGKTIMLPDDVQALDKIGESFRQVSDTDSFYVQDVCERCGLIVERPPDPVEQTDTESLIEMVGQRLTNCGPFERAQVKDSIQELVKLLKAKQPPKDEEEPQVSQVACVKCFNVFTDDIDRCPKCGCERSGK